MFSVCIVTGRYSHRYFNILLSMVTAC